MSKRCKFTSQFKAKVVPELVSGTKTPALACREYGLRDSLVLQVAGGVSGTGLHCVCGQR